MSKKNIFLIVLTIIAVFAVAAAIFVYSQYYVPYQNALSSMDPNSQLTLVEQADGRILVCWSAGENVDEYQFEIFHAQSGWVTYRCSVSGQTSHIIDPLPDDLYTIRITPVADYSVPFEETDRQRKGDQVIEVTANFSTPRINAIGWDTNPSTDQVAVSLSMTQDSVGRIYTVDPDGTIAYAATLNGGKIVLSFGEGREYPTPKEGQPLTFIFDAFRQGPGYVFHSQLSQTCQLLREDLLDDFLSINIKDNGCNSYTLSWNETAGKTYILQGRVVGTEEWTTLATVTDGAPRVYNTPRLAGLVKMEYRVSCPDVSPSIESEVATLQAAGDLLYSTVWPIKALDVYESPNGVTAIGAVTRASAHCVLGMENGMFLIRYADTYGYIDSNYCMINLADYLGDHCLYDIANSYSSLYRAHDYEIPNVTGSLVEGYQYVKVGENQYLVPLLYPAAVKMETAVLTAKDLGYKILIYDSYRPQSATEALHDLAYSFSQSMVPPLETDEETEDTEPAPPMTFGEYMTDFYRYTLSNFIAKGRSRHNLGVAMDLTLVAMDPNMTPTMPLPDGELPPEEPIEPEEPVEPEEPQDPENPEDPENPGEEEEIIPVIGPNGELIMQTVMHDLTWYSERKQNNLNAQILAYIMEGAGFTGIASEWWHYQDNDAYDALNPPALYEGVSSEGWVTDDGETWRYRDAFGQYLTECEQVIEGEYYVFDADGIATWQEFPIVEEEGEENDQIA